MNDLISREAAIASAISGRVRTIQTSEGGENWIRVKEVRESLIELPTIDPKKVVEDYCRPRNLMVVGAECFRLFTEPKPGKWERRNIGGWRCSVCNEQAPFWCMASTQNLSNYCPNCGAPMERSESDGE